MVEETIETIWVADTVSASLNTFRAFIFYIISIKAIITEGSTAFIKFIIEKLLVASQASTGIDTSFTFIRTFLTILGQNVRIGSIRADINARSIIIEFTLRTIQLTLRYTRVLFIIVWSVTSRTLITSPGFTALITI